MQINPANGSNLRANKQYYIDKIESNYKNGQFLEDTIMVVNTMWAPYSPETQDLKPYIHVTNHDFDPKYFGLLWMAAFGQPQSKLYNSEEYIIGKEQEIVKNGVFRNPDLDQLTGVLFLDDDRHCCALNAFGLVPDSIKAKREKGTYSGKKPSRWKVFTTLCEKRWNDESESNAGNL